MNYRLHYFASLADTAGCAAETVRSDASSPSGLYAEVAARHGFAFSADRLRVAVNDALVGWDHALRDNDEIVFLPPVSGG